MSDPGRAIRVLLVDDHPMVRAGLRAMLGGADVEIVGEAGTARDALRLATELLPDVVLLDMRLPDVPGLPALRQLRETVPGSAVLVVTMDDTAAVVRRALAAGAAGYLLKGAGREELLAAVRAVFHGEAVVDPALLRTALAQTRPIPPPGRAADAAGSEPADDLTPVEIDVLRLVANGLTNQEIARELHWSVATVKKYVQRVLAKLDVSDRTQAAVLAIRRGLVG